ncbi:cell surface protein, partial [Candidatus Magnetomorum sp. HK-1]
MIHSKTHMATYENKKSQSYCFSFFISIIISILFLFLTPSNLYAEEQLLSENIQYTYDSMWPLLLQPYYFYNPTAIASDGENVYIADYHHNQIMKFKHSGQFVVQWGSFGNLQGQFYHPVAICYDRKDSTQEIDYLYIADRLNYRIQVFSTTGNYIMEWPFLLDMDDLQFPVITGIAIDKTQRHYDYIYVALFDQDVIQKYDENGTYISEWPDKNNDDIQLDGPEGIVIDIKGNLYIADSKNDRIVKRNPNGDVESFGSRGKNKGEFRNPACITIDQYGYIYVSDLTNRIQKFDLSTNPISQITEWGAYGTTQGKFSNITGLTINNNKIYVVDQYNNRVQQFSLEGEFISQWGQVHETGLNFRKPSNVLADNSGNVYVADSENDRIVKFDYHVNNIQSFGRAKHVHDIAISSKRKIYVTEPFNNQVAVYDEAGVFVTSWGQLGSKDSEFYEPHGIAIDDEDNVFVSDTDNHRIQKFFSDGSFILKWGEEGDRDGQFSSPTGIAIDANNTIYVADSDNARVQIFSSNGIFLRKFGQPGYERHHFQKPYDIALDDKGKIYVVDYHVDRIQIFNNQGEFISNIGKTGNSPGEFSKPQGMCMSNNGIMYVADTMNNRIQSFKPEIKKDEIVKAIIVAGIQEDNDILESSTLSCAQFAYRILELRQIPPDSITFFAGNHSNILKNNYSPEIKYASLTEIKSEIENAYLADILILYLVDHGGKSIFRLNEHETLRFDFLNEWLKPFHGQLITIY